MESKRGAKRRTWGRSWAYGLVAYAGALGSTTGSCSPPPPSTNVGDQATTNLTKFLPDNAYRLVVTIPDPLLAETSYGHALQELATWSTASFGSEAWVQRLDPGPSPEEWKKTDTIPMDDTSYRVSSDAAVAEVGSAVVDRICQHVHEVVARGASDKIANPPKSLLLYLLTTGRGALVAIRSGVTSSLAKQCNDRYPESLANGSEGKFFGYALGLRGALFLAPYAFEKRKSGGRNYELRDPWLFRWMGNEWGAMVPVQWRTGSLTEVVWKNQSLPVLWESLEPQEVASVPEASRSLFKPVVVEQAPLVEKVTPGRRTEETKRYLEHAGAIPLPDAYAKEPVHYLSKEDFVNQVSPAEFLRRWLSLPDAPPLVELAGQKGVRELLRQAKTLTDPLFPEGAAPNARRGYDPLDLAERLCPECTDPAKTAEILPIPIGLREYNATPDDNAEVEKEERNYRGNYRRLDLECLRDYLGAERGACGVDGDETELAVRLVASVYDNFYALNERVNHLVVRGTGVRDEDRVRAYAQRTHRFQPATYRVARLWHAFARSMAVRAVGVDARHPHWSELRALEEGLSRAFFSQQRVPRGELERGHEPNEIYPAMSAALDAFDREFPRLFRDELATWLSTEVTMTYLGIERPVRSYMKMHPDNLFRTLRATTDPPPLTVNFPAVAAHCMPQRARLDAPADAQHPVGQHFELE